MATFKDNYWYKGGFVNRKGIGTGAIVGLALLGLVLLAGMTTCSTAVGVYNNIQTQTTQVDGAASQIKVQMKRRLDLLPNLASVVQGYATHEKSTFVEIAEARAKLGGVLNTKGTDMKALAAANSTLGGALGRLLMISEQYPQLKADQGFRDLQSQIEGTENRITVARTDYNSLVQRYNATIKVFPNNIVAGFMGAQPREFFDTDSASVANPPTLKFTN